MSKGFFLDKEMLDLLSGLSDSVASSVIEVIDSLNIRERVITKGIFQKHFDSFKSLLIEDPCFKDPEGFFGCMGVKKKGEKVLEVSSLGGSNKVKILSAPAFPQKKVEVRDFVNHFRSRYDSIKSILEKRDFDNLSSIRKIGDDRESYTIIACVLSKRFTKNKNLFLEVEDPTGKTIVLINHNKKEVFEKARELLEDDIVAFSVNGSREMLFANEIIFPETALEERRYGDKEAYVAFISDFHAGSKMFLEKNLLRFVRWVNGEEGDNKQKEIAKKVKYIFIVGDVIDGVNHMPGQRKYLDIFTSVGQYKKVEEILKLVRKDVQMIMCPGQHDSVWVGEPQPLISERWAEGLHKMENLHLVSNPAMIEIDSGFKVLMYHGASINQFIEEIPEIRTKYGHNRPTRVVKEMLKRRHLAPIHGLMDYIPCENGDPLVIKEVPDIVATGDQHKAEVSVHNNILLVASSCFQSVTPFEERVGNNPDPCKVPIFNLKTREIKILDFSDSEEEVLVEREAENEKNSN